LGHNPDLGEGTMLIRLYFNTVNFIDRRIAPVATPALTPPRLNPLSANLSQAASHRNLYIIKMKKRKKHAQGGQCVESLTRWFGLISSSVQTSYVTSEPLKKKKVYKKIHIKEKKLQLAPGRRLRMHLSAKERNLPGEPDSEYMPLYLSEMRSFSANQKLKVVRLREHYEVKLIL